MTARKNYRVELIGKNSSAILRETSTVQHAIKHACFASELRIAVRVIDNRTDVEIIVLPPIDREHAIRRPTCKRDKRYYRIARKAAKREKRK